MNEYFYIRKILRTPFKYNIIIGRRTSGKTITEKELRKALKNSKSFNTIITDVYLDEFTRKKVK